MISAIPASGPSGAARWQRFGQIIMDVILHLGAHRTATTTFQHYMRDQIEDFAKDGIAFWGPQRVRKSIFPGLFRQTVAQKGRNVTRRAEGRVRMFAQQCQNRGVQNLLVSDENLLGTPIRNLQAGRLYPAAGERTARISAGFAGRVRRIVLTIRAQDLWWSSVAALTVSRGHPVPLPAQFAAIASNPRSWRDVIADLACAAPGAEIEVIPFERVTGRPDMVFQTALGCAGPFDESERWLNRSADLPQLRQLMAEQGGDPDQLPKGAGRWYPFSPEQAAQLKENYADDLHWLAAGADGLATLTEISHPARAEQIPPAGLTKKGQEHDKGKLAQHR